VKTLAFLLAILFQAPQAAPPPDVQDALRQLRARLDEHRPTFGATDALTGAKHRFRDWIESRMTGFDQGGDVRALGATLHAALAGAGLLCGDLNDECDWNFLGYVDDVRVSRAGAFLVVVTAVGISCGFDESAYVYTWDGQRWRRVWEHERTSYTPKAYLPQIIHDVQISPPDANGARLVLTLGSQTICGGAFKDIYARAWRLESGDMAGLPAPSAVEGKAAAPTYGPPVLDWTAHANDAYPPIQGRVRPDAVVVGFTAGGQTSGEVHSAIRHFRIERRTATQVDPIASLPRDFIVEWLSAPWDESRTRSESASLEARHGELHRTDGVGDFPEATFRCSGDEDLWQVVTQLYEGPKRYYLVRWQRPYRFAVVDISEKPYADCSVKDSRGETYPNVFDDLR